MPDRDRPLDPSGFGPTGARLRNGYVIDRLFEGPSEKYPYLGYRAGTNDHFIWAADGSYFYEGPDSPLDVIELTY